MGVLDNVAARTDSMAIEAGDIPDAEPATETVETAVTEGAAPAIEESPETKARAARLALYEEKLVASREKRQAQRVVEKAKAERKAAAAERKAASEEKAKYDGLKTGSFKETLTALGRDPRQTFEELQREAIEANTPEGIARKEAAKVQAQLDELKAEREAERAERETEKAAFAAREAEIAAHAHQAHIASKFQEAASDPAFADLRIEYPDETLLDHARYYDKHPAELHQHAKSFGVRLTAPEKGFTMHELLHVLSAAQAAHNAAKQARLAARSPAEAQLGKPPTVNGTAERRNAGTVTNDLASQRASTGPAVSGSARERMKQRIEAEVRRAQR